YMPAELTPQMYPNLIPPGTRVPTIANRALLVAYNWPDNSPRYKKLVKFVHELFGKIDQFHDPARHPKWKDVSLPADIPGWTRFKPGAVGLAEHGTVASQQQRQFDAFLSSADRPASAGQSDREVLFREFMEWRRTRNQ